MGAAERRAAPSTLTAVAKRVTESRDLPARREFRLGDQEREELSEIVTMATLEILPNHASDGWRLMVTVEDEVGPRIPEARETAMGRIALAQGRIRIGHDGRSSDVMTAIRQAAD